MSDLQDRLSRFFEKWSEEFARALEMFTGIKPAITSSAAQAEQAQTLDSPLWWKQVYQVQADSDETAPAEQQQFTARPDEIPHVGQKRANALCIHRFLGRFWCHWNRRRIRSVPWMLQIDIWWPMFV